MVPRTLTTAKFPPAPPRRSRCDDRLIALAGDMIDALITTTESETTLTSLPLGIPLELHITALNQAGESVPGPVAGETLG